MTDMNENALLTIQQMYAADSAAIDGGVSGQNLMEAAGMAVCREVIKRWPKQAVVVLCGPGNNGGDGFVAARLLAQQGWPVRLALLGSRADLQGDAARSAERWQGQVFPFDSNVLDGDVLVIDALFGAGLTRPLEGIARQVVETLNRRQLPCLAVDIPSGVQGDTGEILGGQAGVAVQAVVTVTFFRRKPGHLLLPGRDMAGEIVVADIGMPDGVLSGIDLVTYANGPVLWSESLPRARARDNKYTRGHGVVVGGPQMTGAARLAATAARRMGAGLVTIVTPEESFAIYSAGDPGNLIKIIKNESAFGEFLGDPRITAVLVGPGGGISERTRGFALTALASGKPVVLDADALSVFADDPRAMFDAIAGPVVLSPHDGEFKRLFDIGGDKLSRTRKAAQASGAVVLSKGADTVIATPSGNAVINAGAPPTLATAGSGDVLAGFITGLLAQGADAFDSACAGAWLHGRAAAKFGPGLIAEDLAEAVRSVLTELED